MVVRSLFCAMTDRVADFVTRLAGISGWRPSFFIVGGPGLIWLCIWMLSAHATPAGREQPAPRPAAAPARKTVQLGPWLTHPTLIAAAVGNFALSYLLYFFISWFSSYLVPAPISTGFIVSWTGHYTAAFLFTGAVVVCGPPAAAVLGIRPGLPRMADAGGRP